MHNWRLSISIGNQRLQDHQKRNREEIEEIVDGVKVADQNRVELPWNK